MKKIVKILHLFVLVLNLEIFCFIKIQYINEQRGFQVSKYKRNSENVEGNTNAEF